MIFLASKLVLDSSVSFRAVPKILLQIQSEISFLQHQKIPHYTTVIRWITRYGCYLLKRSNKRTCSSNKPWICIADHTIQVGSNKAFIILRIPLKTMKSNRALTFMDATVLSVTVKKSWTGMEIKKVLTKVFKQNDLPTQIVIDGASNLKKGFRMALESFNTDRHTTYDITHYLAGLLKKKYEKSVKHLRLMNAIAKSSKQIAQTMIGYLMPPKLREKSRFLNLPNLAKWLKRLVDVISFGVLTGAEKKLIRKYFGWIYKSEWKCYVQGFTKDILCIKDIQKILKNTGINMFSYQKVASKLSTINDNTFAKEIINTLKKELDYSENKKTPLLLTSDLIESLIGKYKMIAKPHKLSEISKTILAIPCLCEELTPNLTEKAFSKFTQKQADFWVSRNIPKTILSRRKILSDLLKKKASVIELKPQQNDAYPNTTIWAF